MGDSPTHVAICINTAWNIYHFRKDLISDFLERGWKVTCLAPPDGYETKLLEMGCDFIPLEIDQKGTNPLKDIALFAKLIQLMIILKPDVLLTYTIKPNIYSSLGFKIHRVPVIANVSGLGTLFIRKSFASSIARRLYAFAFRQSKKVFFQNEEDRNLFIEKGLVKEDISDLVPGSGIRLRETPEKKLDNGSFTFLMVSRLLYDKGTLEYIKAAETLKTKYPDIRFLLAGKVESLEGLGPGLEQLKRLLEGSGVEYLGYLENPMDHIFNSDCIVLPSYREGLPRCLLEAGLMKRPSIATDVPGCRQIIENEVTGLLCQPKDSDDLRKQMERMIELPETKRIEMGQNARKKVEEEYSHQFVSSKYINAIRKISSV